MSASPPYSEQKYFPKTFICFASDSIFFLEKKYIRNIGLLITDFSILVFPPLDFFSSNHSHFHSPSDVEVCSRTWCICFRGDPGWWLGHRPWLCGECGNNFTWTISDRGQACGLLCILWGGLEEVWDWASPRWDCLAGQLSTVSGAWMIACVETGRRQVQISDVVTDRIWKAVLRKKINWVSFGLWARIWAGHV